MHPMVLYMEEKYRIILVQILDEKPFPWDALTKLKSAFTNQVQRLQRQKVESAEGFRDSFRKNFLKALDYRSFLYKDFIKKYSQK